MLKKFPLIRQLEMMDCAPTCLMMISQYFGKKLNPVMVRELCDKGNRGVSLFGIDKAAGELGFNTSAVKLNVKLFIQQAQLPCIIHWKGDHFVVAYKVTKKHVFIADPALGRLKVNHQEFADFWTNDSINGVALFLQPNGKFNQIDVYAKVSTNGLSRLLRHLFQFKTLLKQLGIGALTGSLLNLIFPFLTQALVDHGIGNRDINFVYTILIAQLVLFFSRTATEFIRGWILVHVGTRVNIAIISEFLTKLMRLPLSYFGRSNLGDVLQRIADHSKIEEFLTSHSVNIVFSMLNLLIFSIIMALYSGAIFSIFFIGSLLSVIWVMLFLNKRKVLDYRQFTQMTRNQNSIVELIHGMPEIKMNQCETKRKWDWQAIQGKLFRNRLDSLAIEQYQQAGNVFLNEGKNIFITFIAAQQVINGEMTLGMMMAISYILGQMNAPVEQLLSFIRLAQDAKISMERLCEIQDMKEEKNPEIEYVKSIPMGEIKLSHLKFKYGRHDTDYVIDDLSFNIPYNKTTAIVGASGSGKTTLMKLLLKFYTASVGQITIKEQNLKILCSDEWRKNCGVVMQDGYIFNESIAKNIAVGQGRLDYERLIHAAKTANIHDEIEKLPQGYFTKIGQEGVGLSGGQIQRILIARAVYKKPQYLFLDEATSALDANNEKIIHDNLQYFFKGRTVLIIAHRLSTVKDADQIIVLQKGKIVEQGNHEDLAKLKGFYFNLVKNQLELGA